MKRSICFGFLAATYMAASTVMAQTPPTIIDLAMQKADLLEPQIITWRRHIHQNPELSYQENNTAAYIKAALESMPGYVIQTGVAETGIKAVLTGGQPGPVVALRADMDALAIEEVNDLPFKSTARGTWQGQDVPISHVCGHDTHVAMLLGAAQVFSDLRADLPGTIVLLFQPAEEGNPTPGGLSGANAMMAEGVLDSPKVDVIMAQHIRAAQPAGGIGYRQGAISAGGYGFTIGLQGEGGHGSSPWTATSPLLAAAEIALSLNNIVAQRTNPTDGTTVVTLGKLQSGIRGNVLPDTASLAGTIRSYSPNNQAIAQDLVRRYAENIAKNHDVTANIVIRGGYDAVISDPATTAMLIPALELATDGIGAHETEPSMASEDFSAFGKNIPLVFWRLFASPYADKDGAPNHSPEFVINEDALRIGTRALLASSLTYMIQSNNP
ncbi:M20 metallopeptidase family protein [Alcaligenes parafaecalis]|uniref:Amidohydrolase n=1 Tax=Alcaligenes parafaecalis TaxID=171260 RepID=A0ABT3VID2_9BURK|nr:amidohydrolase [Alcaligenes parafaecalis]MCX5463233.1 amidohydrolase [Alcaligenes parafaecalis]